MGGPGTGDRYSHPSGIDSPRRFRATGAGAAVSLLAAALLAVGCGGGGGGSAGGAPPPPTATTVAAPTPLSVYPVAGSSAVPTRIFVIVSTVGALTVRLPVAFDTGSAGLTLDALAIFPSSLVTSSGFVFGSGQSTLSYQGITVTNQQGSRAYGGPNGHTQVGNIGFATVTFGNSSGTFTTRTMPVFFYYQVLSTATQQPVSESTQQGWFGVNDAPNQIVVSGGAAPYPACAMGVIGSCWAVGVLKYLDFDAGINAGFVVSPVQIESCDITTDGDCTAQPAVTIGLGASSGAGFSLSPLPCPPPTYTGPAVIEGFTVCQEKVPSTTIASAATPAGSFATAALFDTGTPFLVINVPSGTVFPASIPAGESVTVSTPSGFMYTADSGSGLSTVVVNSGVNGTASVVGLGYFTTNALLVDFATGIQGWK